MTDTILAGTFATDGDRTLAARRLRDAGVLSSATAEFYRSPDGQHVPLSLFTSGEHTQLIGPRSGATAGAGLGALAGTHGGVPIAPVGPLAWEIRATVGADAASVGIPSRRGGLVLAVALIDPTDDPEHGPDVMGIMAASGAIQIEESHGHIKEGDWADYDPASSPRLLLDQSR